jgi:hypothetical protein
VFCGGLFQRPCVDGSGGAITQLALYHMKGTNRILFGRQDSGLTPYPQLCNRITFLLQEREQFWGCLLRKNNKGGSTRRCCEVEATDEQFVRGAVG